MRGELGANRIPKDPDADEGEGPDQVGAFGFDDRPSEAAWVAERIAALLGSAYRDEGGPRGLTPADFAILMRSTGAEEQDGSSRSSAFTSALDDRAIPYTLEAGGSVFGRAQVATLQDVETVYVSIDTPRGFQGILNFMQNIAEVGYQSATDAAVRRPDAVTVSTVHRAKGLEYPVVFVVDVEQRRFPGRADAHSGWLPREMLEQDVNAPRRAYGNNREQEARLFYTALTRAERFLYVTHAAHLPGGGGRARRQSPFLARLTDAAVLREAPAAGDLPPNDLPAAPPRRRVDESLLPTTFSEIR